MYGVAAFGPDASDVGVLSAGEMSISWLGRSTQEHLMVKIYQYIKYYVKRLVP